MVCLTYDSQVSSAVADDVGEFSGYGDCHLGTVRGIDATVARYWVVLCRDVCHIDRCYREDCLLRSLYQLSKEIGSQRRVRILPVFPDRPVLVDEFARRE